MENSTVIMFRTVRLHTTGMGKKKFYAGNSSVMNCFSMGDACDRIEK